MSFTTWLVRANLALLVDLSPGDIERVASDTIMFVRRARACAPLHIRTGLLVLGVLFNVAHALLLFPTPTSPRGRALMALWSRLPDPAPVLLRFYAALTWLRASEHPLIVTHFGFPNMALRAAEMRQKRARLVARDEDSH